MCILRNFNKKLHFFVQVLFNNFDFFHFDFNFFLHFFNLCYGLNFLDSFIILILFFTNSILEHIHDIFFITDFFVGFLINMALLQIVYLSIFFFNDRTQFLFVFGKNINLILEDIDLTIELPDFIYLLLIPVFTLYASLGSSNLIVFECLPLFCLKFRDPSHRRLQIVGQSRIIFFQLFPLSFQFLVVGPGRQQLFVEGLFESIGFLQLFDQILFLLLLLSDCFLEAVVEVPELGLILWVLLL